MKSINLIILIATAIAGCQQTHGNGENPNILFCIMDDASLHMSAYGYNWCQTPTFDKIAEMGILFTNTCTPNAKYAPSRSNILPGRNSWQIE